MILETRALSRRVIVHTPEPADGAGVYVYEMVKALHEADVPVTLLCPENFDYLGQLISAGIQVVRSPVRSVSKASLAARLWRNFVWVAQTATLQYRITRPGDIVHFEFLLHLPLGLISLLLARMQKARVVLKAHDPLPHKWHVPIKFQWMERMMLSWAYRLCDEVIVHNQVGKSILIDTFQYPESRIAVIAHGPIGLQPRRTAYPDLEVLRLLFFGSVRENKGVHLAIQALQNLNNQSGCRMRLTIAGAVPAAHKDYWNRCLDMIRRDSRCIEVLEGHVADAEVAALFASHHAVLMPYLDFFSESGVASLALSNERPLIATGAGGLGELLEASGGGILIEAGSVEGVERAIMSAFNLKSEGLQGMGIVGAEYLRETRSWKKIATRTKSLYFDPPKFELLGQPNANA